MHIAFALFKGNPNLIFFPAEKSILECLMLFDRSSSQLTLRTHSILTNILLLTFRFLHAKRFQITAQDTCQLPTKKTYTYRQLVKN